LKEIRGLFTGLLAVMDAMHPACQIRPTDENVIQVAQTPGPPGTVLLECRPVVCNVPERASHSGADMYVALTGTMGLALSDSGSLVTTSFATNFAYFDVTEAAIVHRLGGHYDHAPSHLGHPWAHLQLTSQVGYFEHVVARFPSLSDLPEPVDAMAQVLGHVRAPSAQVDFLSFLLQICADHLLDAKSGATTQEQFRSLIGSCEPLAGMQQPPGNTACPCLRTVHWYGR
jgi:hypothetical protein